jgi:heme exporter protein A
MALAKPVCYVCCAVYSNQQQVKFVGNRKKSAKYVNTMRVHYSIIGHAGGLKEDLTAIENLHVAETLAGRSMTTSQARLALAAAGLEGRDLMPTRQLSQGQKKRVHLARTALPSAPLLWILDEPFNALDVTGCAWLSDQISAHLKQGGCAILTSHQPVALASGIHEKTLAL